LIKWAEVLSRKVRGEGDLKKIKEIVFVIDKDQLTGPLITKQVKDKTVTSFMLYCPITATDVTAWVLQMMCWEVKEAEQIRQRFLRDFEGTTATYIAYKLKLFFTTWWLSDKDEYSEPQTTLKLTLKRTAKDSGDFDNEAMPYIFDMDFLRVQYRFATSESIDDPGDAEHPILHPDLWIQKPVVKRFTASSPKADTTFKRFRISL
jgi:hypothetical protein